MPNTVDAYIHRIGRTGRAEQTGEAFTFTLPEDEVLVREIEAVLGARIERRRLPDFDYGSFTPDIEASRSRPEPERKALHHRNGGHARRNAPRRQRPSARPVAKSTQPRPHNHDNPHGPRRRRPRRRSPAPAVNPAG